MSASNHASSFRVRLVHTGDATTEKDPLEQCDCDGDAEDTAERRSKSIACARYGIEIRGFCLHAEADDLMQVLEVLDGRSGCRVHVFDRMSGSLVYEGPVNQVYDAVCATCSDVREEAV